MRRARWVLLPVALLALWLAWPHGVTPVVQDGFAPGLRGTERDGAVRATPDGMLVADQDLRRLFDYYLSAIGQRTLPQIRARVSAELDGHPQAARALALFDRYAAFRTALLGWQPVAGEAPAARLARLRALRARYFSPAEVAGLFGQEDAYDAYMVSRLQILADSTLDEAGRAAALAALEARLPPALQKARAAPARIIRLDEAVAAARAAGADESEVQALRSRMVGPAAAQRLASLDAERAAWQQRVAEWQRTRAAILADATLDEAGRRERLAGLLAAFSPSERLRLEALVAP